MNQHHQNIANLIQQAESLTAEQKNAIAKSLKDADKELEIASFKLERTEKVKRTTAILLEETIQELEQKRKAVEAQNRELEIEASLEKVRSRTMGMQKSDELSETAVLLFHQLKSLGLNLKGCGFNIWEKEEKICTSWMNGPDGTLNPPFRLPLTEDPFFIRYYESRKNGEDFWVYETSKEELTTRYKYLRTLPVLGELLAKDSKDGSEIDAHSVIVDHVVNFSNGNLIFITNKAHPEAWDIFKRFGKVFEQTYTRFLDLQKAEAQARESQIELGLERVRARAMAMQKSDELKELISTVFTELIKLDFVLTRCVIMIYDPVTKGSTWWMANSEAPSDPIGLFVQYHELPAYVDYMNAWRERNPRWQFVLKGEMKKEWDEYLFSQTELSKLPDFVIEGMKAPDKVILSSSFNNFGNLTLASLETLSEEHSDIMLRFAKVFDLTYTRFNDLLKAESQARESRIEASLERVRAATHAMHQSSDLLKVINILSDQFQQLGFKIDSANFNTSYQQKDWNLWLYNPGVAMFPDQIHVPYFDHPYFNRTLDSLAKGNNFSSLVFNKEEKDSFLDHLYKNTIAKHVAEERRKWTYSKPGFAWSVVYLANTSITVANYDAEPYTEEQNAILRRFGNVFEQTYTRFLDLQKAEAQTKESQIQLAMERVRARTMAMQKSDELRECVLTIYEQLQNLDFDSNACNIIIIDKESGDTEYWVSGFTQKIFPEGYQVPYLNHPYHENLLTAFRENKKYVVMEYSGQMKQSFDEIFFTQTDFRKVPEQAKQFIIGLKSQKLSTAFFTYGALQVLGPEAISDDKAGILQRLGIVFEQTYTRFLDLQKAEGSARESQIQLALERVRARTMAMQKSAELADAAVVLFQQFAALGEVPDRISIGLVDKQTYTADVWATDQAGTQINIRFKARNDEQTTIEKMMKAWEAGEKSIIIDLQGDDLKNWIIYLRTELGMSINDENFHGRRLHNVSFFSQGWLNITTMEPLPVETLNLLDRFAAVFNLTYTRFNDLQVAEAQTQKAKVETALERVRARALAMQQPEELKEVAEVLRHEMGLLGVEELETCSIYINDEQTEKAECWYALKNSTSPEKKLVNDHFALNLNDTWVGREMLQFYNSAAKQTSIVMKGEQRKEWIRYCEDNSPKFRGYYGEVIPDRTYHLYKFSHGAIGAAVAGEISNESWDLLQRAASVFSLAYSRFKDLTQATIDLQRLKEEKQRAEDALSELQVTQKQLIQSEKMASLGELTAGIAHEIQNPLNFVNNFSEVNRELLAELHDAIEKEDYKEVKIIAKDISGNEEKISHHGKRADAIVKGMLQHSRSSSAIKEPTDINKLADEYLRLAYHGLRAKDKSFNATLKTDYDESIGSINVIPQDIGRAILNLITNAFYVVGEKKKQEAGGYESIVSVSTKMAGNKVELSVKDNGNGIPQKVLDKIFQPFFTTKPTGQGTGLGLSLTYDIIKAHGGEIKVKTSEGEGTTFNIYLPITTV